MSDRLISAHKLWNKINRLPTKWEINGYKTVDKDTVLLWINNAPTVDAVEVVRCKDCRKWCICHKSDDFYCADGERIDDDK